MMLKQKGRWRKLLGLKGHIWYLESEPTQKASVMTPATWSAVIATMGLVTTAVFSFFNFRITQESFTLQHPPVVNVEQVQVVKRNGAFSAEFVFNNTGEGDARDVVVSFLSMDYEKPELMTFVESHPINVNRHDFGSVRVKLPAIDGWHKLPAIVLDLSVRAKNALGQTISQASSCFVIRPDVVVSEKTAGEELELLEKKDCREAHLEGFAFP